MGDPTRRPRHNPRCPAGGGRGPWSRHGPQRATPTGMARSRGLAVSLGDRLGHCRAEGRTLPPPRRQRIRPAPPRARKGIYPHLKDTGGRSGEALHRDGRTVDGGGTGCFGLRHGRPGNHRHRHVVPDGDNRCNADRRSGSAETSGARRHPPYGVGQCHRPLDKHHAGASTGGAGSRPRADLHRAHRDPRRFHDGRFARLDPASRLRRDAAKPRSRTRRQPVPRVPGRPRAPSRWHLRCGPHQLRHVEARIACRRHLHGRRRDFDVAPASLASWCPGLNPRD
jgi:hypothetical protein